ncbi:hypothetical protein AXK11_08685 [Cephaloticoccus primus]|uniref:Ribonuclease VapC n=1 Tax=Cephaloticoccus primus TaxID=1548207 RepID=A0A139SHV6_9BACT|nr:PIN domain-containing protein [Cephaloticoccus primus]KXU34113.1 hypothetical protein AXK11_08685 [Cephaloticoccus primus]
MVKRRIYFPDTNALSGFAARRDEHLVELIERHRSALRLSAVVWFELCYGAEKRKDQLKFEARLEELRHLIPKVEPFDEVAARAAARVRAYLANLKPNAQPIGPLDCLLAGHALALGATVVTNNVREFSRVPGLLVEDWQDTLG